MTFTCGKCGLTQGSHQTFTIEPDLEEQHQVWGAVCGQCGFYGKSRVSAAEWQRLRTKRATPGRALNAPAWLLKVKKLGSAVRWPRLLMINHN